MKPISQSEEMLRGVIAKNLKFLRKKHKMTQSELAQHIGSTQQSIKQYEICQRTMNVPTLLSISKTLEESPDEILKGWEKVF